MLKLVVQKAVHRLKSPCIKLLLSIRTNGAAKIFRLVSNTHRAGKASYENSTIIVQEKNDTQNDPYVIYCSFVILLNG